MGFPRHRCFVYTGAPSNNLKGLSWFLNSQLKAGSRCIYLNSPTMVAGMRSYLAADGVDIARKTTDGTLVLSSDQSHLVKGRFEGPRMLAMLTEEVHRAMADGYKSLFVTGDLTWEFGNERNFDKLLEYEWGLEELFQAYPILNGICQYHRDTLPPKAIEDGLRAHKALFVSDTLSLLNPEYTPPVKGDHLHGHRKASLVQS